MCHCKACQRRTGAVVHSGSRWRKTQVRIEGENKIYARMADSGFEIRFHFCPSCGSNVYCEGDRAPEYYRITVGSFADLGFPAPAFSVWRRLCTRGWACRKKPIVLLKECRRRLPSADDDKTAHQSPDK